MAPSDAASDVLYARYAPCRQRRIQHVSWRNICYSDTVSKPPVSRVSNSAVNLVPASANDPSHDKSASEIESVPAISAVSDPLPDNIVRTTIEEFRTLINEMDDIRETLRARGVPLRTTRMIVELGLQNRLDDQAAAMDSAIEQAAETNGEGSMEREDLESQISTVVSLERDLTHVRAVSRGQGLDAQILSMLTQMIQQSPGDSGAKMVNTFFAYAIAYGVKTEQLQALVESFTETSKSALPQIRRQSKEAQEPQTKRIIQDALLGLVIGLVVIGLLV